ncbi:chitobiase/beta-hexosaminidase C-terminal domain-containing protein [soil metagenome]
MLQFRQLTLNLVYFLNILLIFLLIFEDQVQLPLILQVTGRMHPLVLHFPLALLFVGIFLEWLSTRKKYQHPATREITAYVFYIFALGAAFTALFGFFLYQEGTYQREEVILHKWLGTAVSLMAGLIVWLKERSSVIYYGTLGASAICITLAGHLGAEVTHGKGFLTEPVRRQLQARTVKIDHVDSAIVFRDVIQPILNEKCLNCHNPNKAKNNLNLADYQNIKKGGKNSEAVVPGKAEESLLYQYALLPLEDSLHMPPQGKLQLDQEDIKLIGWWINSGANQHDQYVNLSEVDSIHSIMLSRFQPKTGLDLLEIPFADQQKIKELNNPYRTVQQISATRPYIAVFLGSKKDFSPHDLTELKNIRKQVISLDLGNSVVKDQDLKHISQFPHLQKLHLQNIAIGDEGVKQLSGLSYLETINLSGTKISSGALEEISFWKNLKKLYVYNTAVSEESINKLLNVHPGLEVYNTQIDLSDSVYNAQLTTPVCKIDSGFFRNMANAEIKQSRGRVNYYYTLDGTKPTPSASLYTEPIQVKQSGILKIIATMDGWIDSEVATFTFLKIGIRPDRVYLESKPDPKFSGRMDSTLVDGRSGSLDRGDTEYLGFVGQDFQVLFQLDESRSISKITLSYLEDIDKGIFPPEYIEVWCGEEKDKLKKMGQVQTSLPQEKRPASKSLITQNLPGEPVKYIQIKAKNIGKLPAWHPLPKDTKASIFIDEVAIE